MNINHLKYFYAVCLYGTLSDASEYLYISQPSLSSAIKSLEREFGVQLFNRRHKGMELTAEGKMLFEMSKDILNRTEQIENIMRDFGSERKRLRLGVPPMIGSVILPGIYNDFAKTNPDVMLEITEDGRSALTEKLTENYLDMAFLPQSSAPDTRLEAMKIAHLEIMCCVSKDSPISKCKAVTPELLKDTPLVLFENSFFQTEQIKKWFASEKISPNIILQTKQLSTMLTMISGNVAVGFALKHLIKENKSLKAIATEKPIYLDVSLVWKKDAYCFGSMDKFKRYVKEKNPFGNE